LSPLEVQGLLVYKAIRHYCQAYFKGVQRAFPFSAGAAAGGGGGGKVMQIMQIYVNQVYKYMTNMRIWMSFTLIGWR
jgi:hypothetical protein